MDSPTVLQTDADRALFGGKVDGLVALCYENERPLAGLAGLLDWRFHGAISQCLKHGAITGKVGECVYFPVSRNGQTYHVVLLGAGYSNSPGERGHVPAECLKVLQKNLSSLRLSKVAVSQSDFGKDSPDYFEKNLKGVPVWIVQ